MARRWQCIVHFSHREHIWFKMNECSYCFNKIKNPNQKFGNTEACPKPQLKFLSLSSQYLANNHSNNNNKISVMFID